MKEVTYMFNLHPIKQYKDRNSIVTIYSCPCGKGTIEEINDFTPGHRDNFTHLNCHICSKNYYIDYGKNELSWHLARKSSHSKFKGANIMQIIDQFMQVYIYELEKFLNTKKDKLKEVSFQSDEANTDRPLKEFLKNIIENTFNAIPSNSEIDFIGTDSSTAENIETLKRIKIKKVLLPENITERIKTIIKATKHAVYTNPDMCLELDIDGKIFYETIELKSTKLDSIPGSSIQQILPNEWVIFIKHNAHEINIATGQYIHAINSKMQFPDRSPRPQVSFKELENWNQRNRLLNYKSLLYKNDPDESIKYDLIDDWQNVLSKRWIDMLFNATSVKNNEPWFNNNMRKFILSFLDKYEALTPDKQEDFKKRISSLIIDNN